MKKSYKLTAHHLLAISYMAYFICIAGGIGLSVFFPLHMHIPAANIFAFVCFVSGPLLILWAQYSSFAFEKHKKQHGTISFSFGPYKFLRNPTQIGLGALIIGYVFILQSATVFAAVLLSYLIGNYFYKKHETLLEQKYGKNYKEYKMHVDKIL
jgi:protein-S-isoprenylcysteine O-methyltransferase Ste14